MTLSFSQYLEKFVHPFPEKSVKVVLEMAEEGATVPFMARYRKEKTGNLDEVQIRQIIDGQEKYQEILKRKEFVLKEIETQGSLTPELKKSLEASMDLGEIEEIYRPYKKKKKTKAKIAKDAGLEPLADWIWKLGHGELQDDMTLEVKAKEFLNPAKEIVTYEIALKGAQDIIVEKTSNDPELREIVRKDFYENGKIVSRKAKKFKANSKFEMYQEFEESVKSIQVKKSSHRYLAIRRGWQEGEITVTILGTEDELLKTYENYVCTAENQATEFLKNCAKVALTNHVYPSISNEIHRFLKEKADVDGIEVFAENVRKVLLGSPFGAKCVLGVDPGLRTGCKVALIDKNGAYISSTVLNILGDKAEENAEKLFSEVLKQVQIEAVAVGNGTAGRETEAFIRKTLDKVLKDSEKKIPVVMVSESGASVYSASEVAREEFPDLDLTVRGAISIARRLQDPLAELVKLDPKSIGVGQYQHDISQTLLKKELHYVVEDCVNGVGVDLNTASASLLSYVSGVGPALAKNIVEYREKNGLFEERSQLQEVTRFSAKTFEQAAGFLRIRDGKVSLDSTGVHPERYAAVKDMAAEIGEPVGQLMGEGAKKLLALKEKWSELVGEFTFKDIVSELEKPGRDPRDPFKVFEFRDDIHEVKDLKEGMICPGIVTNVTNFGAFVDIGVHQDGLVHISELTHKFVDDPRKVVSPGDQVKIKVLGVDGEKNQISLSMKITEKPAEKTAGRRDGKSAGGRDGQRAGGGARRGANGEGGDRKRMAPKGGKPGDRSGDRNRSGGKTGGPRKSSGGKPGQQRGNQNTRRPKPSFNNAFAGLAGLKDQLNKK